MPTDNTLKLTLEVTPDELREIVEAVGDRLDKIEAHPKNYEPATAGVVSLLLDRLVRLDAQAS
jgi:hypothetical protein